MARDRHPGDDDDQDDLEGPATFHTFLEEFAHGAVNRRLSARLQELVAACNETGEKGKLAISISVSAKGGMAQVAISVKTSKPEGALPADMFFTGKDGTLHTEDPRQRKLPFKSVAPSRIINIKDDKDKEPS